MAFPMKMWGSRDGVLRWTGRFMLRWRTLVLIAKSDIEGFPSLSDLDKPECPLSAKSRLKQRYFENWRLLC